MSFFSELKRRNVIRVAVLYMVSSWVLLQLADVLTSLLNVPESAGSIVVMLLLLGFFATLAWLVGGFIWGGVSRRSARRVRGLADQLMADAALLPAAGETAAGWAHF